MPATNNAIDGTSADALEHDSDVNAGSPKTHAAKVTVARAQDRAGSSARGG
jgi:outer membrane murein-binding lipoprotein Lpp